MATRQDRTINNCASEIGFATRGITDINLKKIIETISEALKMAHKEIEELKNEVNKLQQTKTD